MRKRDELTDPTSCLSKAHDLEMTFVLLGRDMAAPVAIRAWIAERIRLGKNQPDDAQVVEAELCARIMELEQKADDLTCRYPPGTPCRFWPGAREGEGRQSRIRTNFAVSLGGDVVVWVEDYPGWIAATHVECQEVTK